MNKDLLYKKRWGRLSKQELVALLEKVHRDYGIPLGEERRSAEGAGVPSWAFVRELGALESIVKYLKEDGGYSFHEIAVALRRDDRTVWTTYQRAARKCPRPLARQRVEFSLPVAVVAARLVGVQESIVKYLKEELQLSLHQIARLLHRDNRTVWTVYARVRRKLG